ncbi:unnamed protein product, partial [Staurois parvus]
HVISCVQSQLITDHQGTDDQCGPRSATCQCSSVPVPISATSMPHISAHLSCLSMSPISASQCHPAMPISATYQCCQSVPPISASQCHLSVHISASQFCLSV